MPRLEPWTLRWRNLVCLPVCHYSLEFADQVRLHFDSDPPDAVALELPGHLTEPYGKAIRRLPEISVLLYQASASSTEYLPVEPSDPFAEAARLALENEISLHLVDIRVGEPYPSFRDPVPDPYSIRRIGPLAYYEAFHALRQERADEHPLDQRREQAMAFHLQGLLQQHEKVLFVCGMTHAAGVLHRLSQPQAIPMERKSFPAVQVFHLHPDCLDEVLATSPFLNAVSEIRRKSLPPDPQRERFTVRREFQIHAKPFALVEKEGIASDERAVLQASLIWAARRSGFEGEHPSRPGPTDRNLALWHLFQEAARHYTQETGDTIQAWQKTTFWRFTRNYALIEGLLLPEFYHMLVGARSSVDDNFCHSLLRLGAFYPWQSEHSSQPTLRVSGEDVWLGTRRLRVRRWLPRKKRRPHWIPQRGRKREKYPGEWVEAFDGSALCSHPPEDLVVEDYGRFLRERSLEILRDQLTQTEPFTASLEDGIDIRETLRRGSGKKIYVKTQRALGGKAGAVVVIFDEDDGKNRFPFRMTWLGEHDQESDMAFYATPPEQNVVGPGICRSEYGGFLMIYPPRRLYDVWRDSDYRFFSRKCEVLLAAGLDYSLEKNLVYVAPRPPRTYMRTLAEQLRRKIVYLPLGSLSPSRLGKIRVFHILSGYDKRDVAKDYIG